MSYSIQYLLKSWKDYNTYQKKFATDLQKAHQNKYNNKFIAFRTVLEIVHLSKP